LSRRLSVPDAGRAGSGLRIAELAIPAALAGLVGVLYSGVLRLWWTYDDFYAIHLLKTEPRFAYWLKSDAWSQTHMFTPLLLSSFELDGILAGLTPRAFYVHQLLALAAAAVALYVVLRLWLPRFWAGAVAVLFLVGAPTVNWVEEILVRHYTEGLVAALACLGLFTVALRRNDRRLVALSALAYLIAMLAKEVYVPLIVLLAVMPEGAGRRRIAWLCRAHLPALAIYVAWRWTSTGTLVGGYGWTMTLREIPGLLARLPVLIGRSWLGGRTAWGALLLAAIAVAIVWGFRDRPRAWAVAACGFLLVSLPVLPVSKTFHLRYGGLPWLAACVAVGFAGRNVAARGRRAGPLAAGLLVGVAAAAALAINRGVWEERLRTADRMSAEEIFYVGMSAKDLLRQPLVPPAAMKELRWYRENVLGRAASGGWFADDFFACAGGTNGSRVWGWDARRSAVVDMTAQVRDRAEAYCRSLRPAPLTAEFAYRDGNLLWKLGPYEAGEYSFILDDGVERFDVRRTDGYRNGSPRMSLKVRYESPEGWVTYSPELNLDLVSTRVFTWERHG
jgi:hypothetical protein